MYKGGLGSYGKVPKSVCFFCADSLTAVRLSCGAQLCGGEREGARQEAGGMAGRQEAGVRQYCLVRRESRLPHCILLGTAYCTLYWCMATTVL